MDNKNCKHSPDLSLFQICRLIGTRKYTVSEASRCKFNCKKCGNIIKSTISPKYELNKEIERSIIRNSLLASPLLLAYMWLLTHYGDAAAKWPISIAAALFPILVIVIVYILARIEVAAKFRRGKYGEFVQVTDEQAVAMHDYDELISSPERKELSHRSYKALARVVLVIIAMSLVIAGLIWLLAYVVKNR